MTRLFPLPCLLAHEGFGAACARTVRAHEHAPEKIPSKLWAALLLLLWLASHASTSSAAELRIGSATGYPGDTVELTVSLQGDGETAFADFLIEHSRVAHYASPAATSVAPRATCRVEGSRFRVIWDGTPNTDLVQLCTLRLTIYTYEEPRSNPAISGAPQLCLDAAHEYHSCTFVNGHVDVIYEIERSFIAVLGDPPTAPTLQEVVDFDYADPGATPPLGFVDGVRPQYVRASLIEWGTEYGPWLLEHPQSPIAQLHARGARFTFATLAERAQALASARNDPAVRDIVETLSLIGPKQTYPVLPRENEPFGLYLVGFSCPVIDIANPESRTIEVVGNQIEIDLDPYYPDQACFGVLLPGYSAAIVDMPGLPAGTYNVGIEYLGNRWNEELVIHPTLPASTAPTEIPNPDVRWWLVLGVLILAFRRFSTATR